MERVLVSDVAYVYELWKKYAAAVNVGDIDQWISLWSKDGIQMPPDVRPRIGKEQIRKEVKPQFDLFNTKISIHPEEVRILGERAYSHGLFSTVVRPKDSKTTTEISGKFLTILEKQADGSWKIAVDCFNYNGPGE